MRLILHDQGERYIPPGHDDGVNSRSITKEEGVDVHVTVFPPGAGMEQEVHPAHTHVFFILEGCMSVYMDGKLMGELRNGDAVHIPAGCVHEVRNESQGPMTFLAITYAASAHEPDNIT